MEYSGAGGKLIHEKTRSKKSRDTVPLMEYSGARGKLIHEKNQKQKIS
jgi:hypothetical protein